MKCRTPHCEESPLDGDKWCQGHKAMYARMRAELEADRGPRAPSVKGKRRKARPVK